MYKVRWVAFHHILIVQCYHISACVLYSMWCPVRWDVFLYKQPIRDWCCKPRLLIMWCDIGQWHVVFHMNLNIKHKIMVKGLVLDAVKFNRVLYYRFPLHPFTHTYTHEHTHTHTHTHTHRHHRFVVQYLLQCESEKPGIRLTTLWLVDDPLCHLSLSCPHKEMKWELIFSVLYHAS